MIFVNRNAYVVLAADKQIYNEKKKQSSQATLNIYTSEKSE